MTQAERYKALCTLTRREQLDDSYHAAFYLLSTDGELFQKVCSHIDIDGVDFEAIKRRCRGMNERQRQMLDVAHNLFSWHSRCAATPFDLSRLGYPLLDHVCNALHIANGAVSVRIGANEDGISELVLDDSRRREIIRMHHAMELLENNARNSECHESD